jgi:NagD protein
MSHSPFQEPSVIGPTDALNAEAGSDSSFQQHIQSQLSAPTAGSASPRKLSTSVAKSEALLTDAAIHMTLLQTIRTKKGYIIDMDGVIYHVRLVLVYVWVSVEF